MQMTPEFATFACAAVLAMGAALGVILFNNAVRSALCLVLNFFVLAFVYFTLDARMLGITQIVVYTGAIMVLFLFVIMLLNLGGSQLLSERWDYKKPVGILLGLSLALLVGSQLLPGFMNVRQVGSPAEYGSPQAIGRTLFSEYTVPFESISILLLVGIVGSILLAKRRI